MWSSVQVSNWVDSNCDKKNCQNDNGWQAYEEEDNPIVPEKVKN